MSPETWADNTEAVGKGCREPVAQQRGAHNTRKSSVNHQTQGGHGHKTACRALVKNPILDKP